MRPRRPVHAGSRKRHARPESKAGVICPPVVKLATIVARIPHSVDELKLVARHRHPSTPSGRPNNEILNNRAVAGM